ncbi:MAG: lipid A biosynthesis (KDO)2-(lauroyl)-lipid IVA acyltransferase [Tannerellaceae bacterium]|jgi:predicted LPLAT superfamily acyltransferase|nr:lipid A biosynthesis (KDO)2-(lauroyl)-lipid IVA acyltransferase [Tannerellaceae bacterium]
MTQQWKGNTGGTLLGQKAMLLLFKYLDVRLGYAIVALVAPLYMLFHNKACRAIFRYFRKQWLYSPAKALAQTYLNHFLFGQMILDRFALFSGRAEMFRTEISGNEHFLRLVNSPQGFIIAGSHIGNFEIAGYLLRQNRKTLHALVFPGETPTVQRNRSRILEQNNISLIPVANDMSHLIAMRAALAAGNIVIMPADRMYGSTRSATAPFLRGIARFPVGAPTLAILANVEILAVYVVKQAARAYSVNVIPIAQSASADADKQQRIEACTKAFARSMEETLRKYPAQWFNYYDFWN